MGEQTFEDLVRIAYQAYGDQVNWKNYAGHSMPVWDDLGERVQRGWFAAVNAVLNQIMPVDDDPSRG